MPTTLTETDIANAALARLGATRIVSLDEASDNARLVTTLYPRLRDQVMNDHDWRCIIDRVRLTRASAAPAFGYRYRYRLPVPLLRVLSTDDPTVPYAIEGRFLLSNAPSVQVRYLRREDDVSQWDASLFDVVSTRLSAELAWAIRGQQPVAVTLYEAYLKKLADARKADGYQGFETLPDVVLRALRKLGAVGSPGQVDLATAARLCTEAYPGLRDALLRASEWNFAMVREQLHPVGGGDGVELVYNGDFATGVSGWFDLDSGLTGASSWSAGQLALFGGTAGVGAREQMVVTDIDTEYLLTLTLSDYPCTVRLGTTSAGQELFTDTIYQPGRLAIRFRATTTTTYVGLRQTTNATALVDDVSVQAVVATPPLSDFDFRYEVPRGVGGVPRFIRALEIDALPERRWRIEGGQLLTDEQPVILRYVGQVTEETLFDPAFAEALADRIASDNAMAILGGQSGQQFLQVASARETASTGVSLQEGVVLVRPNQSLTRVRQTWRGQTWWRQ